MGTSTSSNWQNNRVSTHFICKTSDRHSFPSPFIHPWLSPLWLLSAHIHNTCFVIIPSALRNGTLKQPWVKRWKENGICCKTRRSERMREGGGRRGKKLRCEMRSRVRMKGWEEGGLATMIQLKLELKFTAIKDNQTVPGGFSAPELWLDSQTAHLKNPHFQQVEALVVVGTSFRGQIYHLLQDRVKSAGLSVLWFEYRNGEEQRQFRPWPRTPGSLRVQEEAAWSDTDVSL